MVLVLLLVVAVIAVVAIALVAVGRISGQLGAVAKQAIYDRDEAVDFVADLLPDEVTAQLSYEELAQILQFHLDYLQSRGVARAQGDESVIVGPSIASEDDALAWVIGRVAESGIEAEDVWVAQVMEANEQYLRAIGAIGAPLG